MVTENAKDHDSAPVRRDFLYVATAATGAVVAGAATWPLIDALNPSADVVALSSVEVDLADAAPGSRISVKWRGRPVFIWRRTPDVIARARAEDADAMKDPEPDKDRAQREEWLVVIGVCTHLGCIPLGQKEGDALGGWDGWFCPCHGSHYDVAGRIRQGPAPRNLDLPPYQFLTDTLVRIG